MVNAKSYDERVMVFAEAGLLVGDARLVGRAWKGRGGRWKWRANLNDTSFEPGDLMNAGELRIEFEDEIVGRAFCNRVAYSKWGVRVELVGNGRPPGILE